MDTVFVGLRMPADFVESVDREAEKRGVTRSEVFRGRVKNTEKRLSFADNLILAFLGLLLGFIVGLMILIVRYIVFA